MGYQLQHHYLVAFAHSEGLGRTFVITPGPISSVEDVMKLDRRIENLMPQFQRVEILSYQLVSTTV